jgi:hypothetical protein
MERSGLSPITLDDSLGTLYGVFDLLKTETACGVLTVRVGTELELVELTVFRNDAAAIIVLPLMSRICFSIAVLSHTTIVAYVPREVALRPLANVGGRHQRVRKTLASRLRSVRNSKQADFGRKPCSRI